MKKKFFSLRIYIPILLFLCASCSEELMNTEVTTDVPVVEAYIHGEDQQIEIRVSTLAPYTTEADGVQEPISSLEILINDGDNTYALEESEILGTYLLKENSGYLVKSETTLSLAFEYKGEAITAETWVPEKPSNFTASETTVKAYRIPAGSFSFPSFDNIEYTWDNPGGDYYIVTTTFLEDEFDFINGNMEDAEEDFPTESTSRVLEDDIFNINPMQVLFYGTYRIILYRINEEYVNLLDTESQNSQSLTNPLTNVENGWGIFTAYNSDTLYLEVEEEF